MMKKHAIAAALVLFAVAGCGPKGNPFPLIEDMRWTYDGRFEGNVFRDTLALMPIEVEGVTLYGFFEIDEKLEGQLLWGNMFAGDLFRREGDTVYVAEQHHADQQHPLLRMPLKEGATTSWDVGTRTTVTTVEGVERITVPAGSFECRRLSVVVTYGSGNESRHVVWLAPGVGLVKWKRSTGRIDELVHYAVPEPTPPAPEPAPEGATE